jgi:hypothetical protein
MTNFKKAVQVEQLASDAGYGAAAAVPYALVPSLIAKLFKTRMDGWKGWITAVLSTWAVGAAFDIPQFRSAAWSLGSLHLMYAYDLPGKLGLEMWRFDDGTIGGVQGSSGGAGLPAGNSYQNGLRDDGMQPGAQLVSMPDGSQYIAYPETEPMALQEPQEEYAQPGMNDYFRTGQQQPVMAALNPFDEYASM